MQMCVYYTSCPNSLNPVIIKTHTYRGENHTHTHTHTHIACARTHHNNKVLPWNIPSTKKRGEEMLRRWQLIRLDIFVTHKTERQSVCMCVCLCVCVCARTHVLVHVMREAVHVCVWAEGGVDDLLWSGPGRHQHSIIPDLPDDTSRENTLPVSCRLVFFCCLLFIIFRAALPQGQVTICILFLQVFSKLSGVFYFFFLYFIFQRLFFLPLC